MPIMKQVTWIDAAGRKWATLLPDSAPAAHARIGIPLGPPSTEDLPLPLEVQVRLHNQLFDRGLLTEDDVRRRGNEVAAAVMAAYRVDALNVIERFQRKKDPGPL